MNQSAAVNAALAGIIHGVKAAPYGRAYAGGGGVPRQRFPRLPRAATGIPRPAADPFGAYGVRQRRVTVPKLPRLTRGF